MSAAAALRRYAKARHGLSAIEARSGDTETAERDTAITEVMTSWEAVPESLLWAGKLIDRHAYRQAGTVITAPVYRTRLPGIPAALRRYAAAERALCELDITEYAAGITEDSPAFLRANYETAAAHASVPWLLLWVTGLIDRRITRRLDYFNRTGQPCEAWPPVACWLCWLLVTAAIAAGACLITSAVTRPANCTTPSPVPSVFTPAPVATPQVTP